MPYHWLAEYYDTLFGEWAPIAAGIRGKLLGRILPRTVSACDLCCGTGATAVDLARRGMRVFGVDLSAGMCRATRARARRDGVPVRVIRADMRKFRLPEPVDLITCEFDALNHLPQKSDLPAVLHAVARSLHPGGWFYFDVNNRPAFQSAWPTTQFLERPGVASVMHGGYDAARDPDRAWSDVEWFVRSGRCWRRHHERVEEVCWSAEEMTAALHRAGFPSIKSWDAKRFFPNTPLIRRGHRTYYLARRA